MNGAMKNKKGEEYKGATSIKIVGQISTIEEAKEIEDIVELVTIENHIRNLLAKKE